MKQGMWAAALWILNVVAYLAIVGIAVGPALDLPVRIAAIAAAVIYTLLVAIFWGKLDLALQAELATVSLGALLAFSGWRLGSLAAPNGASVLGVSGDVLGAALVLAVLVAAFVSVLAAPRLPIVLRAIVALAIAYPCVPLALAVSHGAGLTEALATNAPLPRDPGWIRGVFVASMVILPLATAATLAVAIVLAVRKRFTGSVRALAGALALALSMQMSGLEAANAGLPDVLAVRGNATMPPAVVVGAAAGAAGLGGAAGTLAGGAAASAGAASPGAAGTATAATSPTPLATATSDAASGGKGFGGLGAAFGNIGGEAAEDLSTSKDQPRQRVGEFLRKLAAAQKYIKHEDYDPAALSLTLAADPAALDKFVRDSIGLDDYSGAMRGAKGTLMSRAGNDIDKAMLLAELLKDKSIPYRFATSTLSASDAGDLAAATANAPQPQTEDFPDAFYADLGVTKDQIAKEHAQRQAWQTAYAARGVAYAKQRASDLLSAISNAQPPADDGTTGSVYTAGAAHTFVQANVGGTWTDLDPSLGRIEPGSHLGGNPVTTVATLAPERFRTVRLRIIATYGGADVNAVDRTVNVADVSGTPISIGASPDVDKIDDAASATAFQTFAMVGQDNKDGTKVALRDAQGRSLTAARLQIDVTGGDAPARSYTRTLWSSGEADPALALSRTYEMLIVPGSVGSSFDAATTLSTIAAMQPLLLYNALPASERKVPTQSDLQPAYPIELLHYLERDELLSTAVAAAGTAPVRFTFDRPDIVMLSNGCVRSGSGVMGTAVVDIVENGRRAVSQDASAARLANVERGVLETSIEQQVLAYLDKTGHGTPQAFAAAKAANIGTAVVAASASLPSGIPARSSGPVKETLAHGQVAYALASPVTMSGSTHYAWWAIDPKTGDTVGRMDDGSGAEMEEESALLFYIKRVGMAFTILGCIIAGPSCGEDAEIGIITGGIGGKGTGGVISEVIGILKNLYEIGGGQYGNGPPNPAPQGNSYSGGGDPNGDGPPPWDGTWPNL